MSQMPPRILRDVNDVDVTFPAAARAAREYLQHEGRALVLRIEKLRERRSERKNRELNAHIRDIARWRCGQMRVPERVFEQVLEDFKGSDVWPRYSDPEPNVFTGEVLYRPKSRGHLSEEEAKGITNWLALFMVQHEIPSHAPTDRWEA